MLPFITKALSNIFAKPNTIAFPAGPAPKAQPNYRGRIAYDPTLCLNCGMCERVCAPNAMTRVEKKLNEEETEITFTFDMTSCTFCGLCADFCPRKAIKLTDDYMIVGSEPKDFEVTGTFIKKMPPKPKFTPEQIAAMKAAAEAKKKAAEEAAKAAAQA